MCTHTQNGFADSVKQMKSTLFHRITLLLPRLTIALESLFAFHPELQGGTPPRRVGKGHAAEARMRSRLGKAGRAMVGAILTQRGRESGLRRARETDSGCNSLPKPGEKKENGGDPSGGRSANHLRKEGRMPRCVP
jgi:hypothetical protein